MTCRETKERNWTHRPVAGIALMLLGLALYPLSDAFIQFLMGSYSVMQTTFLRALMRLIPLTIAIFFQGGIRSVLKTNQAGLHVIRLAINICYTYAFMLSLSLTSLTTIYTLGYTSSLFMIILSALLLKENASREKWIAVAIGMIGVLIAIRPGLTLFEVASLFILFGTFLGALNKILMRKLTRTEHSLAITIYPNVAMILVTMPFAFSHWEPLYAKDLGLFAIVGIVTAIGQYAVAQALRFAKASTLAPIDYSTFLWVVSLDVLWWKKVPDFFTLLGTAIIIGSNLYILYNSHREEKQKNLLQNKLNSETNHANTPS
jgi:drug/metabolite transporter (DMT)-like permease